MTCHLLQQNLPLCLLVEQVVQGLYDGLDVVLIVGRPLAHRVELVPAALQVLRQRLLRCPERPGVPVGALTVAEFALDGVAEPIKAVTAANGVLKYIFILNNR